MLKNIATLIAIGCALTLICGHSQANADQTKIYLSSELLYSQYSQLPPTNPVVYFEATISGNPGDFNGGSLTTPNSNQLIPFNVTCGDLSCSEYSTWPPIPLTSLTTKFPSGKYTVTGTNSIKGTSVSASANYSTSLIPNIIPGISTFSFDQLQNIRRDQGVDLVFNTFTPNSQATRYFTYLSINGGGMPDVVDMYSFDSPINSFYIPPYTLQPGKFYTVELEFADYEQGWSNGITTYAGAQVCNFISFYTNIAIPEPATWTLLIIGVAMIGSAIRRRSDGTAVFAPEQLS